MDGVAPDGVGAGSIARFDVVGGGTGGAFAPGPTVSKVSGCLPVGFSGALGGISYESASSNPSIGWRIEDPEKREGGVTESEVASGTV